MKVKKYKNFRPRIRSRHPSHSVLRSRNKNLPLMPFRSVIRLGSTTELEDTVSKGGDIVELNSVSSIKNSSNKLAMKRCFLNYNVQTAKWWIYDRGFVEETKNGEANRINIEDLPYPIVAKRFYGSRGQGNTKIDSLEDMKEWSKDKTLTNYIYEVFHNYAREYRLHISKEGCFYACRKMMKSDTPDDKKWFRNDANCVWVREDSESNLFDKPINWENIIEHCVRALTSVGLDFGACDLRVQSAKSGTNPHFIVVEINSAPSFGTITEQKYINYLPKLLQLKYERKI